MDDVEITDSDNKMVSSLSFKASPKLAANESVNKEIPDGSLQHGKFFKII